MMIFRFLMQAPIFTASGFALSYVWLVVQNRIWEKSVRAAGVNWGRIFLISLLTGYFFFLFDLTLELPTVVQWGLVWNPVLRLELFGQIRGLLRTLGDDHSIINLYGNIFVFLPIGFTIPLLCKMKHPVLSVTAWGFAISVFIELFQLFVPRITDIDDVMLNTFGVFMGSLCYLVCRKIFPRLHEKLKIPIVSKTQDKT